MATIIGNISTTIKTCGSGAFVTSVTRLVNITFHWIKCVVTVGVNLNLSIRITIKQGEPLFGSVGSNISIIEHIAKGLDVGSDGRHLATVILHLEVG